MAIYTNLSEANKVKQTLSETEEVKEKQQIEPTNINVNPESWDTDTHTLFSSELDSPDKQN